MSDEIKALKAQIDALEKKETGTETGEVQEVSSDVSKPISTFRKTGRVLLGSTKQIQRAYACALCGAIRQQAVEGVKK